MSKGRHIARLPYLMPAPPAAEKYLRQWIGKELYHHPEEFAKLTSEALFGRQAPLTFEIGCGSGEFLVELAKQNPDHCHIGVEVSGRSAYYAVDLARQAALDNLLILRADNTLLYPLMQPDSLHAVYLLFPDPNYGTKHLKKRVVNQQFLDAISHALHPDGLLTIVTDEEPFFMDMLQVIEGEARLEKVHTERFLTTFDPPAKTRFQKAWELKGKPVFRLELRRA